MRASRYRFVMWISFVQRLLAEIVANRIHKTCGAQVATLRFGYPGVFWVTFYWATGLLQGATATWEDTTDPLVILFADIVSRVEFLDVVSTLGVPETTKNLVKEADPAGFYQIKFCEGFCPSFHMARCRAPPVVSRTSTSLISWIPEKMQSSRVGLRQDWVVAECELQQPQTEITVALFADDNTAYTRSSTVEHTEVLLAQPSTSGTSATPGKVALERYRVRGKSTARNSGRPPTCFGSNSLDAFCFLLVGCEASPLTRSWISTYHGTVWDYGHTAQRRKDIPKNSINGGRLTAKMWSQTGVEPPDFASASFVGRLGPIT